MSTDSKPELHVYPVLPLRDVVVYPYMVIPLFVGREKSIKALDTAMGGDKQILLVAQKSAGEDDPGTDQIYNIGSMSNILQLLKLPDGTIKVLVEGAQRARVADYIETDSMFFASTELLEEETQDERAIEILLRPALNQFEQYVKLNKKVPPEILSSLSSIDDPSRLADTIAAHMSIKIEEKQAVLEKVDVRERLEFLISLMETEIDLLNVEKRIRGRVKSQMEKSQREYYLNEQMKAIQKELGEMDEAPQRDGRVERENCQVGHAQGHQEKSGRRVKQIKDDAAHVSRSDGGQELHRLAGKRSLEEAQQDLAGY